MTVIAKSAHSLYSPILNLFALAFDILDASNMQQGQTISASTIYQPRSCATSVHSVGVPSCRLSISFKAYLLLIIVL